MPENNDKVVPALAPLRLFGGPSLLEDVITTILVGRDQAYLNLPWVSARTIRVDATKVGVLDLDRCSLRRRLRRGHHISARRGTSGPTSGASAGRDTHGRWTSHRWTHCSRPPARFASGST